MKIISLDRTALLRRLEAIATRLRTEHPEVSRICTFGSVARGDHTGTSDVDVLLVLEQTEIADPLERIRTFLPYFDLPLGVDLVVLTTAEFERRLAAGDAFAHRIQSEGRPL